MSESQSGKDWAIRFLELLAATDLPIWSQYATGESPSFNVSQLEAIQRQINSLQTSALDLPYLSLSTTTSAWKSRLWATPGSSSISYEPETIWFSGPLVEDE